MRKIDRIFVTFFLFVMVSVLFIMTLIVFKQEDEQQKINQKIDYTYNGFAKSNKDVKDGVIVLAYHRILKNDKLVDLAHHISKNAQLQQYNVYQDEFNRQMVWLKKNKVSVWSTDDLIKHAKANTIKGKHVVLTFDDIDKTLPCNAAQSMFDQDFPFTMFIITGQTGQNLDGEQLATWSEISSLASHSGVTVGLHTNDMHYQENNQPILSSGKISNDEIIKDYQKSKQRVKKELNINSHVFAYPYGSQNTVLTKYMATHGMNGIFLLEPGIVTNNMSNILRDIPRFVVTNTNFIQFQEWLSD